MLLGPQSYALMREAGTRGAALAPVPASGPSPVLLPARDDAAVDRRRGSDEEIDIALCAMLSPCCGFTYWPESRVAILGDPARDFGQHLAAVADEFWRFLAPPLGFALRSAAFLAVIGLIAAFGLLGLRLLVAI